MISASSSFSRAEQPHAQATRRRFLAGAAGLAGAVSVSRVLAQETSPEAGAVEELLFAQIAESGSAEAIEDGYRLTLVHGSGQTLFFTDRPERLAGILETTRFLSDFMADGDDPPECCPGPSSRGQ